MGRCYEMAIEASGINTQKAGRIRRAVEKEWSVDHFDFRKKYASFLGQGNLTGGESEEEFAERATHSIWKANGAYCEVDVKATYLEELPFEIYTFRKKAYGRFRKRVLSRSENQKR